MRAHPPPRRPSRRRTRPLLLLLAVALACLLPSPATGSSPPSLGRVSSFDAGAFARAAARGGRGTPPPAPSSLSPPAAHVSGGARVTIRGVGFVRGPGLAVRFTAEPDVTLDVPATFVSASEVRCVAPRAPRALVAHVAVTNGDGVWSASPLNFVRGAGAPLRFAFDDSDPGCPGCRGVGPQASAPLRERVREVWAAEPAGGPSAGGTRFVVRAVGYAGIIATKNTDGVATEDEPEPVAFRGASRPRGGPRTGGRADPDAGATKPHGTFYPSESLACRMECPLAFASAEAMYAAPPRERFATSDASARFLTLGPGSVIARALHAQARHHAGLRRAEEGKSDAFSSSGFFRRVDVSARWIDYDAVECVSPPKPTVDAEFAARFNVTGVADDCRVAVTNDGVHFDDAFYGDYSSDGSSSDASARALANAARVAFSYSDAAPAIFSLETTHRNPALERRLGVTARGPFDGGAVVTVRGANFAVGSRSALCRFGTHATVDEDQKNKSPAADVPAWVVPALIVDEGTATCVSPRRTPRAFDRSSGRTVPVPGDGSSYDPPAYRPESSDLGSLWPCFVEPVAMSNDGGATWSPASDSARFLYCDVYVEPGGFGFETIGFGSRPFEGGGDRAGTPDAPFASVQSALDAALRAPTRREDAEPDRGASVFSKSAEEEATRSGSGSGGAYYSAVGRSSRDVARGASGFKRTVGGREVSRIHPGTYATGFLESLGAWANVDVVRLAAGAVFGGEDDVELAAEGRAAKIVGSSGGGSSVGAVAANTRIDCRDPERRGFPPRALFADARRAIGEWRVGPEARRGGGGGGGARGVDASAAEAAASAPSGLFFEGVDFVGCDAAAGAREAVPDRCDGWADRRDAESRAPFGGGGGGGGARSSGGGGCRGDAHFVAGGSPGFAAAEKADAGADWAPFDYDDELGGWAPEDGWYDDAG